MLQNYNIFQKLPSPKALIAIKMMKSTPFLNDLIPFIPCHYNSMVLL